MKTPVIFIVFRRPKTTRLVFEAIKQAQPPQLYLVADGPRGPNDVADCESVREVLTDIDWPCEVTRDFADTNLGVANRVTSGITSAFALYEEAIILEDDTLPCPFFFEYCESLLCQWRNEERVQHISGSNFIHNRKADIPHSYYFNNHPSIWGWATWRRAWKHYQLGLPNWPQHKADGLLDRKLKTKAAKQCWEQTLDLHYDNNDPWTWDFQWTYATWARDGLAIAPRQNLVSNIGFGDAATHTSTATAPDLPIHLNHTEEILHPPEPRIEPNLNLVLEKHIHRKQPNKFQRSLSKIRSLLPI